MSRAAAGAPVRVEPAQAPFAGVSDRIVAALRDLAGRPAALFAVLWAANAIRFPYGSLIHDARLYALQVQNQMSGGAFAGDLFLEYGSQDRFTPFSRLAAPVAAMFGIEWTFFVLFLLFNALFLFALQRLVLSLVDEPAVAAAGLVAAALSPLPFGGLGVFRVSEYFFTPRIMSCAVALFALERIVRRRYAAGLALAAASTVIHPLMGFGAVAIGASVALIESLPRRMHVPALAAASIAAVVVLAYRPLGTAIFGTFDPAWHDVNRRAAAYNFPLLWTRRDWVNVAVSIGITSWAALAAAKDSLTRARFLGLCAALGAFGVAAMVVAGVMPYRLLLQGQPYRLLWILAVLHIPLAFWLAARLWTRGPAGQVAAACLVVLPEVITRSNVDIVFGLIAIGFAVLILSHRAASGVTDAIPYGILVGVVIGFAASGAIRLYHVTVRAPMLVSSVGLKTTVDVALNAVGWLVSIAIVLGVLTRLAVRRGSGRGLAAGAAAAAVAAHAVAFAAPRAPSLRHVATPYGRDLPFLETYFRERPRANPAVPPSVYEGIWESTTLLWIDLQSTAYFNLEQLSGVIFNRETAIEGLRRAAIVRPFEMQRFEAVGSMLPWGDVLMIRNLFGTDAPVPTRADLVRLCGRDEPIDVAILGSDFGDLASASNGRVFVYECERVRAAGGE